MSKMNLRAMETSDWYEVADLICVSTNYWYEKHGRVRVFTGGPEATRLFCEVYEALDPGCCLIAEHAETGRLMGSVFYHPRETHVALGIMNVHPNYFGTGVARELLQFVVNYAERENKSVRLVSSAMNLDSFSLYSRAGFVPRRLFQDMLISVPERGLKHSVPGVSKVRNATQEDVPAIGALEMEISNIRREKDFAYFIRNDSAVWHTSVYEDSHGELQGALASVGHRGFHMLGPGFARTEEQAAALVLAELNHYKNRCVLLLVPADCQRLVQTMYGWGARNCELHVAQVLGRFIPFDGVVFPTFMPETG